MQKFKSEQEQKESMLLSAEEAKVRELGATFAHTKQLVRRGLLCGIQRGFADLDEWATGASRVQNSLSFVSSSLDGMAFQSQAQAIRHRKKALREEVEKGLVLVEEVNEVVKAIRAIMSDK